MFSFLVLLKILMEIEKFRKTNRIYWFVKGGLVSEM